MILDLSSIEHSSEQSAPPLPILKECRRRVVGTHPRMLSCRSVRDARRSLLVHLEIEEQVARGRRNAAGEAESLWRQAVEQFSACGGNRGRDYQPQLVDQALLE